MFDEIKNYSIEQIEARSLELAEEIKTADESRLAEINSELDAIEERKKVIATEIEERKADVKEVIEGAGKVIEKNEERTKMKEIRNSKEYIEAFAKYIKTGKDTECRALLTENVTDGVVPVPAFVEDRIRQAWENDEIFSRVSKTYVRGNLKVGFEMSATDAQIHIEGSANVAEETLVLGIVSLVPETIKKWITFSTEVMAMGAESFLSYIYDELSYKIIQKAADVVVSKIQNAPATSTKTAVGVARITDVGSVEGVIDALAELGENARDIVFIANSKTIADYRKLTFSYTYPVDPFQGATPIKNDSLADGVVIIGDLSGVQANLPEGESVRFVFDEYSLAQQDLVKLVGRLYAAIEVVGPKMFAVIKAN